MTATKTRTYTGEGSPVDDYFKPKAPVSTASESWGAFNWNDPKHKLILSLCRQRKWTIPNDKHPSGALADMDGAFSNFLKSPQSPVKKPLNKMTPQEVEKIIVAMGGVVDHKWSK
jgi:hypothetical protein